MMQRFTISRFRAEAGLFFISIWILFTGLSGLFPGTSLIACAEENDTPSQEQASSASADENAPAPEAESVVIVIDPGHGGENLGGQYEDYTEKDMTLIVAKAMKAELEQYEGITVYLTRTEDVDLTLEERCEFAASVGADFLFCLHFNLSTYHTLFGAETWISAFGEQYSRGYAFASIEIELLQEMGLYSRGIKTRLNDSGIDYYGIIRHSTERNMPCVLIEHCHLDQINDQPFYDHQDKLEAFGRLDAEAVARYYGLRSESLGKDFRNYQNISVPVPTQTMKPDSTQPDICMVELLEQNMDNGNVTLSVSAADYDSGMLYYTYSYDGGATFSDLQRWPDKSRDTFQFTINIPSGTVPQIVVNAYNGYDLYTTSNSLSLPSMSYGEKDTENAADADAAQEAADAQSPETDTNAQGTDTDAVESTSDSVVSKDAQDAAREETAEEETQETRPLTMGYFVQVCLICAALVFAMVLSMIVILKSYKKRHRKGHK
ncbi:MAG: N-acetylmuramoyl-L-alanine amidase [Roseburia sp.]|nr:N-acetylmuramoyl-L-alanine amidase [Roseburia sp.]MCM1242953.1 N-acetylmuramoyl-L-alanine amidase [Roseburia sp.]